MDDMNNLRSSTLSSKCYEQLNTLDHMNNFELRVVYAINDTGF